MRKYIAKGKYFAGGKETESWYDAGTQAALLEMLFIGKDPSGASCRGDDCCCGFGLFAGTRDSRLDEEVCTMCEFDIIEVVGE